MKTTKHHLLFILVSILYVILFTLVVMLLVAFKPAVPSTDTLEKIYTQTDRPFYVPGETIWFKSYVVAQDHTISTKSAVLYAELIAPKGVAVKTLKLAIKNGYAYGDFEINPQWVGGMYRLKMYTNWMRNFGEASFFTKTITVQKVVKPNVLFKLKFKNEGYGKGAKVTANFEAKNLKNVALRHSDFSFKVSVKGGAILSKKLTTNADGKAVLQFTLPAQLRTTDVVLNVLMPYKGTTESISRPVPVVLDTLDVQFLPESGQLIAGTSNRLAFKATDEFGKPVDIAGNILDEKGVVVRTFSSFHDGMGSVNIPVESHKTYYAKVTTPFLSKRPIALPKVHRKGTRFSVITDRLKTSLRLFSTEKDPMTVRVVKGTKIVYENSILPSQSTLSITTENFPIGIFKFSIINTNGAIVAERLAFLNAHKQLKVSIALDKSVYNTREKVKATLTTTDAKGHPIPANVSVAVADEKLLSFADDKQAHILSYLLLSSELKGRLHKPSFYFNPEEKKAEQALEYVMLTHGWRTYIDRSTLTLKNARFKPETQNMCSGKVVDKKGQPRKAKLLLFNENNSDVLVFETDHKGAFQFEKPKSQRCVLLAYNEEQEQLRIIKHQVKETRFNRFGTTDLKQSQEFKVVEKPLKGVIKQEAKANLMLSEDASSLEEVVVVGYSAVERELLLSYVKVEEIDALSGVQGRLAGVQISNTTGPSSGFDIAIRGSSSISGIGPLYIIDGVVADAKALDNIPFHQIESVEVLKDGAETAIYGAQGGNGVLLINTKYKSFYNNYYKKKLNKTKKYKNYSTAIFYSSDTPLFYQSKLFYTPRYDSAALVEERNDFRQTIYWNPVIETNEKGKAQFEFYNSDAISAFKMTVEGIGYNGLLGRQEKIYSTNQLLNLDFKMPNYMTLNDTVVLPVSITNEKKSAVAVNLSLELPEHLKLLEAFESTFEIGADTTLLKRIKVMPVKKGEVFIKAGLSSNSGHDSVKRNATILSPYFPIETTVSGTNNGTFSFNINTKVTGSLEANFNIYTDVVGTVMDGIEGLIKKPYGCFEQTSSATYPNVMVLKYLKEAGKNNPEVEAKAMDFIKAGYERLISFETKVGGFEWFGHTPPHETLTAYGILEFTEMKAIYDAVDQNMINRTAKWLLGRKDGKGGFKKSKQGYDSFASSPRDVANAYIVYALTEAKVEAHLDLEYRTAYQDALSTNDTYKMALMALASYNLNATKNANVLLDKLRFNIAQYGFGKLPVNQTITRTYGDSKQIETLALTLLALMRDYTANREVVTKGIEYLVTKRKHNKFGSTQSTAMALKALICYTKYEKQNIITKTDAVALVINDKTLHQNLRCDNEGKIVIENLSNHFTEGVQTVTVRFSNPDVTFPYALNINWDSTVPESSKDSPLVLKTEIAKQDYQVGDNVSLFVNVVNTKATRLGMVTAIIGIPSGATLQPWQLKQLVEQQKAAYYELFNNYLVLYWREFDASETKTIRLALKADIAGCYKAPASTAYLYYGDEFKTWISGNDLEIRN